MKVFVLGTSHSGKTPLARAIADGLGFPVVSAGEWVTGHQATNAADMQDFIDRTTAESVRRLREDHRSGITYFAATYGTLEHSVIDGQRNPYDFIQLFSPAEDLAVTVTHASNHVPVSDFDTGVAVIGEYLDWLLRNGLIRACQDRRYRFDRLYKAHGGGHGSSLQEGIEVVLRQLKMDVLEHTTTMLRVE